MEWFFIRAIDQTGAITTWGLFSNYFKAEEALIRMASNNNVIAATIHKIEEKKISSIEELKNIFKSSNPSKNKPSNN